MQAHSKAIEWRFEALIATPQAGKLLPGLSEIKYANGLTSFPVER
jgi:hypothetical protein